MRGGPNAAALAAPTTIDIHVASVLAGRVLAESIPVVSATLEASTDRTPRERLTLKAPHGWVPRDPGEPLNNYGQRLHVTQTIATGGVTTRVKVGVYQIDAWEETSTGGISVTAYDLLQRCEKNPMDWPSSPPGGATVSSEFQRLAGAPDEGGLQVIVDDGDQPIPRTFKWGTSRTEAMGKLAEAYGLAWTVRPDGCLHVWKPTTGVASETYTGRDLLIEAARKSNERRPNRWFVGTTGETPEGGGDAPHYDGIATLYDAPYQPDVYDAPYQPDVYGVVTDRSEMQMTDLEGTVQKAAETYRAKALAARGTRSLALISDPRIELWDTISVETGSEVITGTVTGYSIDLVDSDAQMRVDLEVYANVHAR